jgi:hypothetical protein
MEHETFMSLLMDPAHWCFELFLIFIFDGLVGMVVWPCFRRFALHHRKDDNKVAVLEQQVKEMRAILGLKDEE